MVGPQDVQDPEDVLCGLGPGLRKRPHLWSQTSGCRTRGRGHLLNLRFIICKTEVTVVSTS